MIGAINDEYIDRRPLQSLGSRKTAKAAANDHDKRRFCLHFQPSAFSIRKANSALCLYLGTGCNPWNEDQLLIYKFFETEIRQFLAIARAFDSPKRQVRPADVGIVYEHHSGLDTAGDSFGPLNTCGIYGTAEAKRRVIRDRDGFFFIFCRKDQGNRPKELLFVSRVIRLQVDQDGWFKEGPHSAESATPQQDLCTVARRVTDLAKDELECSI